MVFIIRIYTQVVMLVDFTTLYSSVPVCTDC